MNLISMRQHSITNFKRFFGRFLTGTQVNLYLIYPPLPPHPKIQTPLFRVKVSYVSLFIALAI